MTRTFPAVCDPTLVVGHNKVADHTSGDKDNRGDGVGQANPGILGRSAPAPRWASDRSPLVKGDELLALGTAHAARLGDQPMGVIDLDGSLRWANASLRTVVGLSQDADLDGLLSWSLAPWLRQAPFAWAALQGGAPASFEAPLQIAGNPVALRARLAPVRGADQQVLGAAVFVQTTTSPEGDTEGVHPLALIDIETGLDNVAAIEIALHRGGTERRRLAVVIVRLQAYDDVHTAYGRKPALSFLRYAAEQIEDRFGARPARVGHNELAFVLRDDPAGSPAEEVLDALADPILISPLLRAMADPAVGVARGPGNPLLLVHARSAMVEAARTPRSASADYRGCFIADTARDLGQAVALQQAITDGALHILLQPGRRLRDAAPRWAEALVRFDAPELADLGVGDLIAITERSGSIVDLGQQVMRLAATALGDLRRRGIELDLLSVNLSAVQLGSDDLAQQIAAIVTEAGESCDSFALELTETAVMADPPMALRQFERLRSCGFTIMIDDFGAGQSSLRRLVELPFDVLKLDHSLLQKVHQDANRRLVLEAVIRLAQDLGRTVIAEGVESAADATLLVELGVHLAQGHWFGPAMRTDDAALLATPWDVWTPVTG
ncbi:hypothetical protein BH23ACT9_BH23ACT9_01290 [soil metagenome]